MTIVIRCWDNLRFFISLLMDVSGTAGTEIRAEAGVAAMAETVTVEEVTAAMAGLAVAIRWVEVAMEEPKASRLAVR